MLWFSRVCRLLNLANCLSVSLSICLSRNKKRETRTPHSLTTHCYRKQYPAHFLPYLWHLRWKNLVDLQVCRRGTLARYSGGTSIWARWDPFGPGGWVLTWAPNTGSWGTASMNPAWRQWGGGPGHHYLLCEVAVPRQHARHSLPACRCSKTQGNVVFRATVTVLLHLLLYNKHNTLPFCVSFNHNKQWQL